MPRLTEYAALDGGGGGGGDGGGLPTACVPTSRSASNTFRPPPDTPNVTVEIGKGTDVTLHGYLWTGEED